MTTFTYKQSTGELFYSPGGLSSVDPALRLGIGYAGNGLGKNNVQFQNVHNVGPIPQGTYTIGAFTKHPTKGPNVCKLYPWKKNEMFGRSAFLIHGDSITHPGMASEGCPTLGPSIREIIKDSSVKVLEVVA